MKALTLTILLITAAAVAVAGVAPGDDAIEFKLTDTAGKEHSLHQYLADGHVVVLEWFNPDCPFIKKHHKSTQNVNELAAKHSAEGVIWLAVNSAGPGKQGFGLERNQKAVTEYGMPFPVLLDPDGKVGHAYGAKTTPHMFVIAPDGKVAYAGALDDDRTAGAPGKVNYVDGAVTALLAGDEVKPAETKPYG